MNTPEILPHYNEVDVTRCVQLDRASKILRLGTTRVAESPVRMHAWNYVDGEGYGRTVILNPRFLYGVWRIKQTLINNLSEVGHKETAADIIAKYERHR